MKLFDKFKELVIEISGLKKQIKKLKLVNDYYKNAWDKEKHNRKQLERLLYKITSKNKSLANISYEVNNSGSFFK